MIGREAYPACVRVEKPPVDTIVQDVLHLPTAVEEYRQHALPQFYYTRVLFGLGRLRRVVCHGVLLGYWWYDEGGVKVDQCRAQRREFGVSALYFETLLSC